MTSIRLEKAKNRNLPRTESCASHCYEVRTEMELELNLEGRQYR